MIKKEKLQDIISKYYLGVNERVIWNITDKKLTIKFTNQSKDVIGTVITDGVDLENCSLPIFDTKKLLSLIGICDDEITLYISKQSNKPNKIQISDKNFNATYTLANEKLIGKTANASHNKWEVHMSLSKDDITNIIKAKSAISDTDVLTVSPLNELGSTHCEFIFGEESSHSNKVTYSVKCDKVEEEFKTPYNSEFFKMIMIANKNMDSGEIFMSKMGLMKISFKSNDTTCEYFMVRKPISTF